MFNAKFWNISTEKLSENKIAIKDYIVAKIDEFLNISTLTPYRVLTRCKRNEIEDLLQKLYQKAPPGRLAEYVWNHFESVNSMKSELVKLSMLLASIGEEIDKNRELILDEKRSDEVLPLLEKRRDQSDNSDEVNSKNPRLENSYKPVEQKLEPSEFEENDGYPIPELSIINSNAYNFSNPEKPAHFQRTLLQSKAGPSSPMLRSSSSSAPMVVIFPKYSKSNSEVNKYGPVIKNIRRSQQQYPSILTPKTTFINQTDVYMGDDDNTVVPTNSTYTRKRNPSSRSPKKPRRKDAVVGGLYNIMNGYHTTIRRLNQKLEKPNLSADEIEKYTAELNEVKNNFQKGVLQRTLNNRAKSFFLPIMNQRILDGFVTYEAAYEFINHENSEIREIMQTVLNETVDSNIWMNAISSRDIWYQSFLDLKKYRLFEDERMGN
uniref:Uncharacterized protein n=1 Tax=Panagrolaimus sp. PS1159 TaxID=55785 RepID=A0AC35GV27_9BILA